MKKIKKGISILLTVMLILSAMPIASISSFAEGTSDDFSYIVLSNGTAEITGYTGEEEAVQIPSSVDGYTVSSIGEEAFKEVRNFTSVIIPDTVTNIGNRAFAYTNLISVTIPNSVTVLGIGAFEHCQQLESVNIGNGVSKIKSDTFFYCDSLTDITLSEGLDMIGDNAFRYCQALEGITIPSTVTAIGNYAFSECYSLESLVIPDKVITIGEDAFSYCNSLINVKLGSKVKRIKSRAFYACHSFTTINIPKSVTTIEDNAFMFCDSLTSINIPVNVSLIGDGAFSSCNKLKSINVVSDNVSYCSENGVLFNKDKTVLMQYPTGKSETYYSAPASVVKICDGAFAECEALESISLPEGLIEIGYYAFGGCSGLLSMTLPSTVTTIGSEAFEACTSLQSINIPNGVKVIDFATFASCESLESITIPESVENISEGAFSWCTSLESIDVAEGNQNFASDNGVLLNKEKTELILIPSGKTGSYTVPNGVTNIYYHAVYTSSLTSINIPATVTEIDSMAFKSCNSLSEINIAQGNNYYSSADGVLFNKDKTELICCPIGKAGSYNIPNTVVTVDYVAFAECQSLISVTVPSSVTELGEYAFSGCTSLTSVNIGDGLTYISESLFYDCSSLTDISIPENVTEIGDYAFGNCTSLVSISIPDSVTQIEEGAFSGCSSLESVHIGSGLTSIGSYLFYGCSSLTSIVIPNNVTKISYFAFCDCTSLSSIIIPNTVTELGNYAFDNCTSLEAITLPAGIVCINYHLFYGCTSLKSVTIPRSILSVEGYAFGECTSLTDIYYYGDSDDWENIYIANNENSNDYFINANLHFIECNHTDTTTINQSPDCTNCGYENHIICNICGSVVSDGYLSPLGHVFETDNCMRCGKGLESSHPYENDINESFTVIRKGAKKISITFSENTETEESFDTIKIYNKTGNVVGEYSGDELAGKTVTVRGESVKIVLSTDGSVTGYGFAITDVTAEYYAAPEKILIESAHPYEDDSDELWVIKRPGASKISITFSEDTEVEKDFDFIKIYDSYFPVYEYTGNSLAGETVTVNGDTLCIGLVSDDSVTRYGFEVVEIKTEYPDGTVIYSQSQFDNSGDIDGNGSVDSNDYAMARSYTLCNSNLTADQKRFADINHDGTVDAFDAIKIDLIFSNI